MLHLFLELLVIEFAVLLVNATAFNYRYQFPDVVLFTGYGWVYARVALVVSWIVAFLLYWDHLFNNFWNVWKKNWVLLIFISLAVLSLMWTVDLPATLYKLAFLLFSSWVAAYLAVRYGWKGVVNLLMVVGGVFTLVSIFMVTFTPYGVMKSEPFTGSWNVIFWHRNHAGNLFAFFNALFLTRFVGDGTLRWGKRVFLAILYLFSAILVFGSRSATGVVVFLVLNLATLLFLGWARWHSCFRRWHYFLAGVVFLAGFLIFITHTGFFFGLLNRSPSITGRIPLWKDLFFNFYLQKPILGYGYGALWMQESFRNLMELRQGWVFQVYFADNGFFDILLNLGAVGLGAFLLAFFLLGVRGFKKAVSQKTWISFFPLLVFLYVFTGNLTYSFLLEIEQFVWMIFLMALFSSSLPFPSGGEPVRSLEPDGGLEKGGQPAHQEDQQSPPVKPAKDHIMQD